MEKLTYIHDVKWFGRKPVCVLGHVVEVKLLRTQLGNSHKIGIFQKLDRQNLNCLYMKFFYANHSTVRS